MGAGAGAPRGLAKVMAQISDTLLSGTNATFIAELYARYLADSASVDPSWGAFFAELDEDSLNRF